MPSSDLPVWKQMVAGGAAGFSSCLAGYPMDLIKTSLQAQKLDMKGLMREKVLNIWRGSLFPLLVGTASGAFYFMILEQTRSLIKRRTGTENLTTSLEFLAGAASGFVSGLMPSFSEVVKINLQINRTNYKNSFDFVTKQWNREMIRVYFRSFCLCTAIGALGSGTFFSTYFYVYNNFFKNSKLAGFYSGAVSSFVTWNVVFWFDMVKTLVISSGKEFSVDRLKMQMRSMKSKDLAAIYLLGVVRGVTADSFSLLTYDVVTKLLKHEKL